jgi:hypothetical protein
VEADLKVKKPTAPLKDAKQNLIGSPHITLRNYTVWCKVFAVPKFHVIVVLCRRELKSSVFALLFGGVPVDWQYNRFERGR